MFYANYMYIFYFVVTIHHLMYALAMLPVHQ